MWWRPREVHRLGDATCGADQRHRHERRLGAEAFEAVPGGAHEPAVAAHTPRTSSGCRLSAARTLRRAHVRSVGVVEIVAVRIFVRLAADGADEDRAHTVETTGYPLCRTWGCVVGCARTFRPSVAAGQAGPRPSGRTRVNAAASRRGGAHRVAVRPPRREHRQGVRPTARARRTRGRGRNDRAPAVSQFDHFFFRTRKQKAFSPFCQA